MLLKVVSTAVLPKTPDSGLEIDNSEDPIKDRQMVTKYMQENEELRYCIWRCYLCDNFLRRTKFGYFAH